MILPQERQKGMGGATPSTDQMTKVKQVPIVGQATR